MSNLRTSDIRESCRQASTGAWEHQSIEIFTAICLSRASSTAMKPKKFFFVLRFLRLAFLSPGTSQKFRRTLVADVGKLPVANCSVQFVENEYCKLLLSFWESEESPVCEPHPFFHPQNIGNLRSTKIPSLILLALRLMTQSRSHSWSWFEKRFERLRQNPVVAMEILKYVASHLDQIMNPSVYLPVLTSDSPLIDFITPEMVRMMVPRRPHQLNNSWIQSALSNEYFVPDIIDLVAAYFQALLSNPELEAKQVQELRREELRLAHSLFLVRQSVESAVQLARVLNDNKDVLDSLNLVVKGLAILEDVRFLPVVVLVIRQSLSAEENERLAIYAQSSAFPFESRKLALQMIVQQSPSSGEAAFRWAAAETSDPARFGEVMRA
jgi:hypothetical protein